MDYYYGLLWIGCPLKRSFCNVQDILIGLTTQPIVYKREALQNPSKRNKKNNRSRQGTNDKSKIYLKKQYLQNSEWSALISLFTIKVSDVYI